MAVRPQPRRAVLTSRNSNIRSRSRAAWNEASATEIGHAVKVDHRNNTLVSRWVRLGRQRSGTPIGHSHSIEYPTRGVLVCSEHRDHSFWHCLCCWYQVAAVSRFSLANNGSRIHCRVLPHGSPRQRHEVPSYSDAHICQASVLSDSSSYSLNSK